LPPASLTKLMTALIIFEEGNLLDQVTMIGADLIGGANMGAQAGETYTVEQLLWGLLVPSANEAAMALARHHSGQVFVFVQRMNLRAQELGLAHTNFVNPEGFDEDGHRASARDLLAVTQELWQYPLFREIVGSSTVTLGGRALRSTNELLGVDPEVDGVKTGTTDEAGQCLIVSVDRGGHQFYIAIMNSQDRFADARVIKAQIEQSYIWRTATLPVRPTALDRLFDAEGNRWFLAAEGPSPSLLLPAWEAARLRPYRTIYPLPEDPWTSGSEVGVLEWRYGDVVVGTQRLILR
ncbi:MAG: D-alanyl-D-alanine carboxypeptidase, partial [Caldilineaceae bacterium]|nr:D-alanyl-D-alanine carboxypeptidase [Caldilineaceae bacterium]